MQSFGFDRHITRYTTRYKAVSRGYLLVLVFWWGMMSLVGWGWYMRSLEQPSALLQEAQKSSVLVAGILPRVGSAIHHASVLGEHIAQNRPRLPVYADELDRLMDELGELEEKPYLATLFSGHTVLRSLIGDYPDWQDDFHDLLGAQEPQTYLVILQNTAEKRPNGGFFGSFVKVTIDRGRIVEQKIIDSYHPGFDRPGAHVTGPERLLGFLPDRDIYFVGANKIGFTYQDGAYIKTLYEKSYPGQRIRGVLFVSTDMFVDAVPGFREKLWTRQFANAATDLIRGDERGKKELYLDAASTYFRTHGVLLARSLLTHLDELVAKGYINIYLENISGALHSYLREQGLTTRFEEDTMYFRDSNISYSKVDSFVDKEITIATATGQVITTTTNEEVPLPNLPAGAYTATIRYHLHVPAYYVDFMASLAEKYNVTLTEREIHILAIKPRWATRGVVYMPQDFTAGAMTGDMYHHDTFSTPFSHNVYYKAKMLENDMAAVIQFNFRKDAIEKI